MSDKMSEARRAAFLAALAQSGNQTLAAERAKVSRSWVVQLRRTDATFRRDTDAAIAAARARLAAAASVQPPSRWRDQQGEELIVKGGNRRRVQIVRARLMAITPRVEARFLAALSQTCNVLAACRAVGVSAPGIYDHRDRWPDFARRWDRAIADGYDALTFATIAAAGAMLGDAEMTPEPGMAPPTVAQAIEAMRLHQRRMRGEGCRRSWRRRPHTMDEVRSEVLKRIEAIAGAARHKARLAGRDPDACLHCGGLAHSGGSAGSC